MLIADPVRQTLALTTLASVHAGRTFSDAGPVFGWEEEAGEVRGAVLMTPPFEPQLAVVRPESIPSLVGALRDRVEPLPGVHGEPRTAEAFAAAWTEGTARRSRIPLVVRLQALGTLAPPDPPPPGHGRPATGADQALAVPGCGPPSSLPDDPWRSGAPCRRSGRAGPRASPADPADPLVGTIYRRIGFAPVGDCPILRFG